APPKPRSIPWPGPESAARLATGPRIVASTEMEKAGAASAPDTVAFDETGVKRELTGPAAKLVAGVALAFSVYQLIIAAFAPLSSLPTRSIHVGFLLALAFLIYPISRHANRRRIALHDALIALVAFALALYHLVFESALIQRSGDPSIADL